MVEEPNAPLADTASGDTKKEDTTSAPQGQSRDIIPTAEGQTKTDQTKVEFNIPDEYKEMPWVTKVASTEDLWKQLASTQEMVGKKQSVPDFTTATPQEIENFFAQSRPAEATDYSFNNEEGTELNPIQEALGKLMHDNGISKFQADKLIEGYQALEGQQAETMFDKDTFLESMKEAFGKDHEQKIDATRQFIESNLNDAQKEVLGAIPNNILGMVYQLAANIQESHGINESGIGGKHGAGNMPIEDLKAQASKIRAEISALDRDPMHTAEDRQKKIDELQAINEQRIKRGDQ